MTLAGCFTDIAIAQTSGGAASPANVGGLNDTEALRRIEAALPREAAVAPQRPRKLLIFDLNVGYGGHPSAAYASEALRLMGERTGAFQTAVSHEPSVFRPENLQAFDAVFFNNTVGNLFTDPELRESLVRFVYRGGGMLGVHGTSVAFTQWPGAKEDWPEFGVMIGARGANHRESNERVFIKLDDADHPLNRLFGGAGFEYRDEFFRVHEPYSRSRVRVLLTMDTEKTDMNQGPPRGDCMRADNDYALAWVRGYGRGRVFYCTIAHNPYVFWDPLMLKFYLAAVQFALGDLSAPTTPSARLTPALRAQEKLGWRLGLPADGGAKSPTLFEAIDHAAALGLVYVGAADSQRVSQDTPRSFDPQLTAVELRQVRLKLDAAGVRLLTYAVREWPREPTSCARLFQFSRDMGVETVIADPRPEALPAIDQLCLAHEVHLALRNGSPKAILKACEGRSKHIGVCVEFAGGRLAGSDPVTAARLFKDRLMIVEIPNQPARGRRDQDRLERAAAAETERLLRELHRLQVRPTMFAVEAPPGSARPGVPNIELLDRVCRAVAP